MKQIDEQRYLWLFRVFGLFLIISIFLNLILLIAFSKIAPEPKKELFFVSSQNGKVDALYITKTNNDNFNISQDSVGYEIAYNYISEYIVNRESVYSDRNKMSEIFGLYGIIYNLSSKSVYEKFISSENYEYSIVNKDKNIKTVKIDSLKYQPNSNKWIAEISVKTTNFDGLKPQNSKKKISITCLFSKQSVIKTGKNKWINPLGFEITEYEYLKY